MKTTLHWLVGLFFAGAALLSGCSSRPSLPTAALAPPSPTLPPTLTSP